MSRKKTMKSVREAKDRRAKRLAIGGGILLAIVLAWEVPHFLGSKKAAAPPAPTTAVSTTTTPGTTAPATSTPTTPPATAAPTASAKLTNSDLPPSNSKQQLTGFSTFASKDPFDQQVTANTGLTGSGSGSGSGAGTGSASAPASGSAPASSSPVVTSSRMLAHSGAVMLMVNGKRESVRVGASFPSSNPIFRLVAVTSGAVRIGIANGSYASGAQTIRLSNGRPVTLVDTADGVRYTVRLISG